MNKEFNLSNYIAIEETGLGWIQTVKVKKFIKLLKEELSKRGHLDLGTRAIVLMLIDKLVGDKLK